MKGLLIKDLRLMVKQQKIFSSVVFIAVLLAVVTGNTFFIISYMTFVASLFTLTSISYDEFDNGNAFLFSLPITRRMYVKEKYGVAMLLGGGLWVVSTVFAVAVGEMKKTVPMGDTLIAACGILPIMLVMLAVMLPVQLKYGGEKGRMATIVMGGGVFVLAIVLARAAQWLGIDVEECLEKLQMMDAGTGAAVAVAVAAVALLVSVRASISIMEKKEF